MSEEKRVVFGIDLGTTYSCISYVDESENVVVIKNAENDTTTPSVVCYEDGENIVVGETAKSTAMLYPDQTISFVKRSMGKPGVKFNVGGKEYTPEEVSSHILRKLVKDASDATGMEVKDVVITHPAYFGINEKQATKDAGKIAGLNVVSILDEPVAAAYSYGCQNEDSVILVYDLGGGTFDVTMIDIKTVNGEKNINVVCTGGDAELGGKDWDDAIIMYFASEFEREKGIPADSLLDDVEMRQELVIEAEKAKKQLSSKEKSVTAINFDGEKARIEITREKFNEITEALLERTIMKTRDLLEEAKQKGYTSFDKLLLVGGSTYMPQVSEKIKEEFGIEPQRFDPNEAVSKGAALFGHSKAYEKAVSEAIKEIVPEHNTDNPADVKQFSLPQQEKIKSELAKQGYTLGGVTVANINTVTSQSFGIKAFVGGSSGDMKPMIVNIITKNTTLPANSTQRFGTNENNQDNVLIELFESEVADELMEVDMGKQIGNATLDLPSGLPANSPIDVTLGLTAEGLLSVTAIEPSSGKSCDISIETTSCMSDEQIEKAIKENSGISVGDDGGFTPVENSDEDEW